MVQEGGKRRKSKSSKKSSRKSSKKSSRRSSRKMSKASRKSSRKSSKKSSRRSSKGSKKSKSSKKSRRVAPPSILVRGAIIKFLWANFRNEIMKAAESKGMKSIGVSSKIVEMSLSDAKKKHPMKESDKHSTPYWDGVKKEAMSLLKENINKYAAAIKK